MQEKLLTRKELASELKKTRCYVSMMCRMGFQMPGGTATLKEARDFLIRNPSPYGKANKSLQLLTLKH